ncbi:MAG: hypothetical protein ABR575_07615 [Actinomycetota bacterium]
MIKRTSLRTLVHRSLDPSGENRRPVCAWLTASAIALSLVIQVTAFAEASRAPVATSTRAGSRAGSQDDKEFIWSFKCVGFGGFFTVDAATVRSEGNIPQEFVLAGEETGLAVLFLAAFDCNPAVVDGEDAPFLYSLATVNLSSHPGSYDFFKFTDNPRVHSRFQRFGVWVQHLHHMSVDVPVANGVLLSAQADVPSPSSPFTLSAAPATSLPNHVDIPDSPSDHWSDGPLGTVWGADNNCEGRIDPAVVTAEVPEGTPLARILGDERVTAPGVFLRLSASGHVAFAHRTQRPAGCPTWD